MTTFKLVRVDKIYRTPSKVISELMAREKIHLANCRHVGSVPEETLDIMRKIKSWKYVIIMNDFLPRGVWPTKISKHSLFPFCSIYKNGLGTSVLENREALADGNYFLCVDGVEEGPKENGLTPAEEMTRSSGHEYRYHVDIELTNIYRSHPAYVNLDRDPDNIGDSSWDGNLVSWMRAGYTTRIQYAVKSGLISEDV